jgi:integrase
MDFFTKDEMEYIFRLVDSDDDYRINKLRFKLILLIGFTSGLRLFEILKLRVRDVMSGAYDIEGK